MILQGSIVTYIIKHRLAYSSTYPPLPILGSGPCFLAGGLANDMSSVLSPRLYRNRTVIQMHL